MIVLGIDPGYAIVGYGVLNYDGNHFAVVDYGSIQTSAGQEFIDRIEKIHRGVSLLLEKYKVDEVAIEELFFSKNTKTAIDVAQARGVILLAARQYGAGVYEYTPMQVKQGICGYGGAPKEQVQGIVKTILNLKEIPKPDDTADALAIAVSHCHTNKFSKLFKIK
ncbi:MAG: crossover junction endodeoxyribonuclease RuvC [Filifactor alocis]|nr:crossover junction endodeoxyribonuclease RuvC [Filifactor alocis]